ncbi:MAG: hypothetical protein BGO01_10270 [Armatimonadetes bacterium 55-13]|nr:hypothetical protein [Armatimonadota bacterium]OJU62783.1 MAG: hypothetical protein BGO01_10270 [Armatimonadetes bacterium 55-13]
MFRLFILGGAAFLLAGCQSAPSVAGSYRVEVGNGTEVVEVGKLALKDDGSFQMNSGQTNMSGTWRQSGDRVTFEAGGSAAQMLSTKEFKAVGNQLKPIVEGKELTHWRFTRE